MFSNVSKVFLPLKNILKVKSVLKFEKRFNKSGLTPQFSAHPLLSVALKSLRAYKKHVP